MMATHCLESETLAPHDQEGAVARGQRWLASLPGGQHDHDLQLHAQHAFEQAWQTMHTAKDHATARGHALNQRDSELDRREAFLRAREEAMADVERQHQQWQQQLEGRETAVQGRELAVQQLEDVVEGNYLTSEDVVENFVELLEFMDGVEQQPMAESPMARPPGVYVNGALLKQQIGSCHPSSTARWMSHARLTSGSDMRPSTTLYVLGAQD